MDENVSAQNIGWVLQFQDDATPDLEKAANTFDRTRVILEHVANTAVDSADTLEETSKKYENIFEAIVSGAKSVSNNVGISFEKISGSIPTPGSMNVEGSVDISQNLLPPTLNSDQMQQNLQASATVTPSLNDTGVRNIMDSFWTDFQSRSSVELSIFAINFYKTLSHQQLQSIFWNQFSDRQLIQTVFIKNFHDALKADRTIVHMFMNRFRALGIYFGRTVASVVNRSLDFALKRFTKKLAKMNLTINVNTKPNRPSPGQNPLTPKSGGSNTFVAPSLFSRAFGSVAGQIVAAFSFMKIIDSVFGPLIERITWLVSQLIFPFIEVTMILWDKFYPVLLEILPLLHQLAYAILDPLVGIMSALYPVVKIVAIVFGSLLKAVFDVIGVGLKFVGWILQIPGLAKAAGIAVSAWLVLTFGTWLKGAVIAATIAIVNWIRSLYAAIVASRLASLATSAYTLTVIALNKGIWAASSALMSGFIPNVIAATTAAWGFVTALLANPITWIILGIVAAVGLVIGVVYLLWDTIKTVFSAIYDCISPIVDLGYTLISTVFGGIIDVVKELWSVISTVFSAVGSVIGGVLKVVGTIVKGIFSLIADYVIRPIASIISWVGSAISSVVKFLGKAAPVIGQLLLIALGPIGWIILGVHYLIKLFKWLFTTTEDGSKNTFRWFDLILVPLKWIGKALSFIIDLIGTFISIVVWPFKKLGELLEWVGGLFSGLIDTIWSGVSSVLGWIGSLTSGIGEFFVGIYDNVKDSVKGAVSWIGDKVSGAWDWIKNTVGGWFSSDTPTETAKKDIAETSKAPATPTTSMASAPENTVNSPVTTTTSDALNKQMSFGSSDAIVDNYVTPIDYAVDQLQTISTVGAQAQNVKPAANVVTPASLPKISVKQDDRIINSLVQESKNDVTLVKAIEKQTAILGSKLDQLKSPIEDLDIDDLIGLGSFDR